MAHDSRKCHRRKHGRAALRRGRVDTAAAYSLIERAGRMVRRLQCADELNSAQWERLRFLAATALAADDTDCLHIDFIRCGRAERE